MAHAVFLKNRETGRFYRMSIWYQSLVAAEQARDSWQETLPDREVVVADDDLVMGEAV